MCSKSKNGLHETFNVPDFAKGTWCMGILDFDDMLCWFAMTKRALSIDFCWDCMTTWRYLRLCGGICPNSFLNRSVGVRFCLYNWELGTFCWKSCCKTRLCGWCYFIFSNLTVDDVDANMFLCVQWAQKTRVAQVAGIITVHTLVWASVRVCCDISVALAKQEVS